MAAFCQYKCFRISLSSFVSTCVGLSSINANTRRYNSEATDATSGPPNKNTSLSMLACPWKMLSWVTFSKSPKGKEGLIASITLKTRNYFVQSKETFLTIDYWQLGIALKTVACWPSI